MTVHRHSDQPGRPPAADGQALNFSTLVFSARAWMQSRAELDNFPLLLVPHLHPQFTEDQRSLVGERLPFEIQGHLSLSE